LAKQHQEVLAKLDPLAVARYQITEKDIQTIERYLQIIENPLLAGEILGQACNVAAAVEGREAGIGGFYQGYLTLIKQAIFYESTGARVGWLWTAAAKAVISCQPQDRPTKSWGQISK
jgi:hypothetical protein